MKRKAIAFVAIAALALAVALGATAKPAKQTATVLSIVLPTAIGGIVTGTTLAVARAAGETAPLLFTCALAGQLVSWDPTNSAASIPVTIFQYSESPDRHLNAQAWAAAFVLIFVVLLASLIARTMLERNRRKLGQAR